MDVARTQTLSKAAKTDGEGGEEGTGGEVDSKEFDRLKAKYKKLEGVHSSPPHLLLTKVAKVCVPLARHLSLKVDSTRWAGTTRGFGTDLSSFEPCLACFGPLSAPGGEWGQSVQ